jgi:hypothetical protein
MLPRPCPEREPLVSALNLESLTGRQICFRSTVDGITVCSQQDLGDYRLKFRASHWLTNSFPLYARWYDDVFSAELGRSSLEILGISLADRIFSALCLIALRYVLGRIQEVVG